MSIKKYIRFLKYKLKGIGEKWAFEHPIRLIKNVQISPGVSIGKYSYIVSGRIYEGTKIGRYCSIAENVAIGAGNHPVDWISTSPFFYGGIFGIKTKQRSCQADMEPTVIGNDVWIGANAFIKQGVIIGDGAVIGAGAVVVKNLPPYSIAVGNPAKVIRYRFDESTIARLLALRWWDLEESLLMNLPSDRIELCIEEIHKRKQT